MVPTAALEAAEKSSKGAAVWRNLCLKWVRTMLGLPARYPSAIAAWEAVPREHRHPGPPPPGKPGFYRGPAGSAGHVVLGIDGALDAGLVANVEAAAVARKILNPGGLKSEQVDDYAYSRVSDAAQVDVTLTDEEWALLTPSRSERGAFSITPQWSS